MRDTSVISFTYYIPGVAGAFREPGPVLTHFKKIPYYSNIKSFSLPSTGVERAN